MNVRAQVLAVFAICAFALTPSVFTAAAPQQTPSQPATNLAYCPPANGDPNQAAEKLMVDAQVVAEPQPARPGELCQICNEPVGQADVVYIVNGQRVPVHRGACLTSLQSRPQHFLAFLQPRGAFLGSQEGGPGLSRFWFLFGVYVLLGLIFGALSAHRALHAGYSPLAWFGLGFLLNVIGYAALLARPKREVFAPAGVPAGLGKIAVTYAPQACPHCGYPNHPSASQCLGCGAPLKPAVVAETVRVGLRPNPS